MDLLRIAARVAAEPDGVPGDMEGAVSVDAFTGTLSSRFDGENNSAEGRIVIDGAEKAITVNATASDRGAHYTLDGQEVPWDSPLHEALDIYFSDIWPPESGSWDATVEAGVISKPPTPADDGDPDQGPPSDPGPPWDTHEEKRGEK